MKHPRDGISAAIAARGSAYLHLLRTLDRRLGADEAESIMSEALRAHGAAGALSYSEASRGGDLAALAVEFVARKEGDGDAFVRSAEGPADNVLRIRLGACPLVRAWRAAGCSPEEIDRLCRVASAADHGKFEDGFGLELDFEARIAAGDSCCILRLRPRKGNA